MNVQTSTDTMPVSRVLARAADELTLCVQMLARIEASVMPVMVAGEAGQDRPAVSSTVQDIDLLGQCLEDLSLCLGSLAGAPTVRRSDPVDIRIVLGKLRLADLRGRFSGEPAALRDAATPIELF